MNKTNNLSFYIINDFIKNVFFLSNLRKMAKSN